MARNASDVLVDTLLAWGVDTVFGLPGDGVNGIMEALRQRRDRVRFIQVRHEEAAALMACAHAKFTGRLGVCLGTSGPGGIHLLNGLYDAKLDGAPVLAITGHTYSDLIGSHYVQDVDLDRVFADVALYCQRVMGVKHVPLVTNIACRAALSHRGVAHLQVPIDVQLEEAPTDGIGPHAGWGHASSTFAVPVVVPIKEDLRRAAEVLNRGRRVVVLVGQGALGAQEEVLEIADRLAAPIVKALLGKAVVADDHPLCLGGLGLLGTAPAETAMEQCDTLLMVGTNFPYMDYLPRPGQARAVQIDINPVRLGTRYPVDVGLVGDARETLHLLLPMIRRKDHRDWLERLQRQMTDWWQLMEHRGTHKDVPMKPQVVAWYLNEFLADDAIITADSGTVTAWTARHVKMRPTMKFSLSGALATMASGLPYAIAAQLAYPGCQVVAIVGDGAFTMLMGEFATAVKYRLPIKVIVMKNNTLAQIRWEQIVFLGNPEYGVDLQPIDFAKYAVACGGVGISVDHPEAVRGAFQEAMRVNDRPVLVEALVDPDEPPWPSRLRGEQVLHFAQALARGEPAGGRLGLTLFREKVEEALAGRQRS